MATALVVNDVWELKVYCYDETQVAINRYLFYVYGVAGTGSTDVALAIAFDANYGPAYQALLGTSESYRGITLGRLRPAPVMQPVENTTSRANGVIASPCMGKQTCGLLKKETGFIGRKWRGRVYLPFPTSSSNTTSGIPNAGYLVNANNLAILYMTPLTVGGGGNTATVRACLWNKTTNALREVTTAYAEMVWATQKRRGDFGKRNPLPL